MRIVVRTAGGSHCQVLPGSSWTCHDLHMDIQMKLGIPASQQRLLHGSKLLETRMAAVGVVTIGHLLQLLAGHGDTLELLLYIRSTVVTEALEAVKKDGHALRHVSEELKRDREVVMEAVKQAGYAFRHASEELKRDREVVMEAVAHNGYAFRHASEELKRDREVVMEAVKYNSGAFQHASEELKGDREVVIEAFNQYRDVLQHASRS